MQMSVPKCECRPVFVCPTVNFTFVARQHTVAEPVLPSSVTPLKGRRCAQWTEYGSRLVNSSADRSSHRFAHDHKYGARNRWKRPSQSTRMDLVSREKRAHCDGNIEIAPSGRGPYAIWTIFELCATISVRLGRVLSLPCRRIRLGV